MNISKLKRALEVPEWLWEVLILVTIAPGIAVGLSAISSFPVV